MNHAGRRAGPVLTAVILKAAILAAALCAPAGTASAQTYPTKLIRLVVPNAAGGPSDLVGRILAQKLTETLGQTTIVENRVGAAGNVGTDAVAKSTPDGHTLLFTTSGPITLNPSLYKMPYDPIRDLAPVSLLASTPLLLTVSPTLEVSSVAELIKLAKTRPGKLNYASTGVGNNQHLAFEMLKAQSGIDIVHVPFRAYTQVVAAVTTGEVPMMMAPLSALSLARTGKVKALAVTGKKRSSFASDIPTLAESGFPDYEVALWFGLFAPAGTPPGIISRLHSESVRALEQPDARQRLSGLAIETVGTTPEQLVALIASETETWAKLIKSIGIKPE